MLGESIISANSNITTDDANLTATFCDLGAFLSHVGEDELSAEVQERSLAASRLRGQLSRKRKRSLSTVAKVHPTKKAREKQETREAQKPAPQRLMTTVNATLPGSSHVRVYHSAETLLLDPDTPTYSLSIATPTTAAALRNIPRRIDIRREPFRRYLYELGILSPETFFSRLVKLEKRFAQR